MNVLVIGSGGREHALAWKIAQSNLLDELYIAPGNAGTQKTGKNIQIVSSDFKSLSDLVKERNIKMVVVGPESPLVDGLYDYFMNDPGLKDVAVIGTPKSGALLEGSKSFAKQFMERNNIPSAGFAGFSKDEIAHGEEYLATLSPPYVLKADGLAAGKGVLIINDLKEAQKELDHLLSGKFGKASEKVIIEEYMDGIELSVFILTDGKSYKILPEAKDYKKIGEQDTGLNTGGMGAVSPVPFADKNFMEKVEEKVIKPTIDGLQKDDIPYKGFLYIGLMKINEEPYVVEYNARMGDPEAEVVIPRINNDILELFSMLENGTLSEAEIDIDARTAATIILASAGYPEHYEKGKEITRIDDVKQSIVFHAGTKLSKGHVVTNGGRVIAITALGNNLDEALQKCYQDAEIIHFEGKYYRKDIGFDIK